MKKRNIHFYALSIVFLAVAVVFYQETNLSLGKFILFFMCGFVSGVTFLRALKKIS